MSKLKALLDMKFIAAVVTLSSLLGIALAEPIRQKRADSTPLGQIYAYGNNISGFPVFQASGVVYIGNVSTSTISGAANVTCKLIESSTQSMIANKESTLVQSKRLERPSWSTRSTTTEPRPTAANISRSIPPTVLRILFSSPIRRLNLDTLQIASTSMVHRSPGSLPRGKWNHGSMLVRQIRTEYSSCIGRQTPRQRLKARQLC